MKRLTLTIAGFMLCLFGAATLVQAQTSTGTIKGVVVDETGSPAENVEVLVLANGTTIYDFTDDQGAYDFRLGEGSYVVGVRLTTQDQNGIRTYTEYYDGTSFLHEATELSLAAGQTIEGINFEVPDLSNVLTVSEMVISGTVTDEAGSPLAGAFVMVNDVRGLVTPDTAFTDAQGNYTIRTQGYIQRLKAWSFNAGYNLQFYDGQPSLFTATEIVVDPNNPVVTGIDFALEAQGSNSTGNSIQGRVLSEAGTPVRDALVVGLNAETEEVAYAVSNFQGNYTIEGLKGGDYYVLFLAQGFLPQFFGNAPRWQEAQPVQVQGVTLDVDVQLGGMNRPPIGGGKLMGSGGEASLTGIVRLDDSSPSGNTLVTIHDDQDQIIAFDLTDPQGVFEVSDAVPGTFTVQANRVRFEDAQQSVTLADVEFFAQTFVSMTLNASTPTSVGEDDVPASFQLDQNYPNPFNPETVIGFTLPQAAHVTLSVYDVLGREVARLVDGPQPAGTTTVRFEAPGGLPSGVYYYRLEAGVLSRTGRMVLLR